MDITEQYVLEIVSRTRSMADRCERLNARSHVSAASRLLTITYCNVCHILAKAAVNIIRESRTAILDTDDAGGELEPVEDAAPRLDINKEEFDLLRQVDLLLQKLGPRVQILENSIPEDLPWSLVPKFQKVVDALIPKTTVVLCPHWDYSYAVHLVDIYDALTTELGEFQDYVEELIQDTVLKNLPRPFFLIYFPPLERKNILLHSLLGHELGHILVHNILSQTDPESDEKETDVEKRKTNLVSLILPVVREGVKDDLRAKAIPDDNLFYGPLLTDSIAQETHSAVLMWERMVVECVSDIVGVTLFGPAALFASLYVALQDGLDRFPSEGTQYYPPWRYRIRWMVRTLEGKVKPRMQDLPPLDKIFFPLPIRLFDPGLEKKINQYYEAIRAATLEEVDIEVLKRNRLSAAILDHAEKTIEEIADTILSTIVEKDLHCAPDRLYTLLPELIARLDHRIPPNADERVADDIKIASLAQIMNAAWFHKLSWQGGFWLRAVGGEYLFDEKILQKRDRMNNLTLKAVEFSEIQREFHRRMDR
ncbi:MAG TPA: hypothetical protein ENI68_00940 [Gammaproteobacteria bacterium]|nr:hypothetical protein [Gammaproteobacteria bacterium]